MTCITLLCGPVRKLPFSLQQLPIPGICLDGRFTHEFIILEVDGKLNGECICQERRYACTYVCSSVATFSLSQSETDVSGRSPMCPDAGDPGVSPGKLLEFFMWFGAFWCNLVAVVCTGAPDPMHLSLCNKNWTDPGWVYYTKPSIAILT